MLIFVVYSRYKSKESYQPIFLWIIMKILVVEPIIQDAMFDYEQTNYKKSALFFPRLDYLQLFNSFKKNYQS